MPNETAHQEHLVRRAKAAATHSTTRAVRQLLYAHEAARIEHLLRQLVGEQRQKRGRKASARQLFAMRASLHKGVHLSRDTARAKG